jgi:YVTN family beta-propeller protein
MKAVHVSIFLILVIAMLGVANAGSLALVSNTITTPIDLGQSASYSLIGISGGIAPYTFNAYFTNANVPATNVFTGSNTFTPSASSNEITLEISTDASYTNNVVVTAYNGLPGAGNFLFTNTLTVTGSNTVYGAWTFNAFFADSTGANTISSSNIVTINPSLTTPTISPSNPTIDSGQSVTFSSTWSGGTPDYTAKLFSSTTSTCNTGSTLVQTLSSLTSGSASFSSVSPTSTTYYCIFITDSATTAVTTNSVNSEVTINPVLSTPTISPSNPTISSGQSVTFTASWSGGTPTYGASLYASPTSACNQQSTLIQQDIALSANTVTFSPVTPSQQTYYCIFVTDNSINAYSLSPSITSGLNNPEGVAFSPSGTYTYVTNSESNNVVIINTGSNTVTDSITSGFSTPKTIAISPSGTYAYVTNCNSSCSGTGPDNVVIINTATNTVTGSITSGFDYPYGVSFSPSGTYAYVTNNHGNNVVIINTATNSVTGSIASGIYEPYGVAFSPSGTYAYVTNYFGQNVVIINTATNTVTGSITSGFSVPTGVSFSPSGTYAYVTNRGSENVVIINTATNSVTGSITSGFFSPYGVAISPSGTYAYVTNCNIACAGSGPDNVLIINTGVQIANSINSEVTVNTGPQVSNPYAGGPTGYFGPGPTPTIPTSTTSVTTVSTTTILPVTTISPKSITVVNASASVPTPLCNDSSGYIIYYQSLNATFHITSGTNTCFDAIAVNATTLSKSVNNSVITAVNYTINRANVSTDATLHYSCSIPNSDVAPFILRNGTWQEITPFTLNAAACTVEFAVPSDPVIALLNTAHPNTTTANTTSTVISSYTSTPNQPNSGFIYILLLIIIIIIIAVLLYYMTRRRR